MLEIVFTTAFRRDFKKVKKQGKNLSILQNVIDDLSRQNILDKKMRDHSLYSGL